MLGLSKLESFLGRASDRRMARPPGLTYWLDEKPPLGVAFGLALQQVAIQSVYFVLPAAVASVVTRDVGEATRFLSLSILAVVLFQVLQLLTRGPIGSGYPVPGTHTASLLSAYALIGRAGGGFGGIGAMLILTGLAAFALTFVVRRLRVVLPNEVAGVVVLLIGVALIGLAATQMGLQAGGTPRGEHAVIVVLGSLAVMAAIALSRTRAAPFAVLIGVVFGAVLALLLGEGIPNAGAILAARPWIAVPLPFAPHIGAFSVQALFAYLLALVAIKATAMGSFVVVQRGADKEWNRPDAPPLRRGLLANALSIVGAGLIGGAAPGPATAAVGLAVATGTLARRIVWCGVPLLLVVAMSPKLVAIAFLTPPAVKAAMLLYVSGFIMAQGCQLATARLLDTRRTMIVAFGLSAGVLVGVAPGPFQATVPAIASPLSFGALVAFLVNLVTLPLVKRTAERTFALDAGAGRVASDWVETVAAGWGLKERTSLFASHALDELVHVLLGRGVATLAVAAARAEDRIELRLLWQGDLLPKPTLRPRVEDLLTDPDAQAGVAMWMATRESQAFTQSKSPRGAEARLIFED